MKDSGFSLIIISTSVLPAIFASYITYCLIATFCSTSLPVHDEFEWLQNIGTIHQLSSPAVIKYKHSTVDSMPASRPATPGLIISSWLFFAEKWDSITATLLGWWTVSRLNSNSNPSSPGESSAAKKEKERIVVKLTAVSAGDLGVLLELGHLRLKLLVLVQQPVGRRLLGGDVSLDPGQFLQKSQWD